MMALPGGYNEGLERPRNKADKAATTRYNYSALNCAVWKVESRWGGWCREKTRRRDGAFQWTDANFEAIKVRGTVGHGPSAG